MKTLLALLVFAAPAFASAPPYSGITQPAGGVVTQYLTGNFCIARTSNTAGTCLINENATDGPSHRMTNNSTPTDVLFEWVQARMGLASSLGYEKQGPYPMWFMTNSTQPVVSGVNNVEAEREYYNADGNGPGVAFKRDPWVDVRAYGAKGDGSTDDTAAIQSALNLTFSGGKTLFFPMGTYKISSALVLNSSTTLASNGATIKQVTSSTSIFTADGTQTAHLTNISVSGLRFLGTEASAVSFAFKMNWVDNVTIDKNRFEQIHLIFLGEGNDSFSTVSTATLSNNIVISNNWLKNGAEDGDAQIFLRYLKNSRVTNNVMLGLAGDTGGSGIELFGGNSDPADNGAIGVPINLALVKCSEITVDGNIASNQASLVQVAQCHNVAVTNNVGNAAGEALWVGASANVVFAGNSVSNGGNDAVWQTQGIIQNVTFDSNVLYSSSNARGVYVGSAWSTNKSPGPLRFTNNIVYSYIGNAGEINGIGDFTMRGNTFYNIHAVILGPTHDLVVEDNRFIYDLFSTDVSYGSYLLRVSKYNSNMAGLPGATTGYTRIRGNVWEDRTGARQSITIFLGASGDLNGAPASNVYIENNVFKGHSNNTDLSLALGAGTTDTVLISGNKFGGGLDFNGNNGASIRHVLFKDNLNLDGTAYLGRSPVAGDSGTLFFSTGSVIGSTNPATLGLGWINTAEGSPGTWVPIGSILTSTASANLTGGLANEVPYQTGAGATTFTAQPGANVVLTANSGAPAWTNTPTLTGTNFSSIPESAVTSLVSDLASKASTGTNTSITNLAGLTTISNAFTATSSETITASGGLGLATLNGLGAGIAVSTSVTLTGTSSMTIVNSTFSITGVILMGGGGAVTKIPVISMNGSNFFTTVTSTAAGSASYGQLGYSSTFGAQGTPVFTWTSAGTVYLATPTPATATQIYRCNGGTDAGWVLYGNSGAAQTLCTGGGGSLTATGVFLP